MSDEAWRKWLWTEDDIQFWNNKYRGRAMQVSFMDGSLPDDSLEIPVDNVVTVDFTKPQRKTITGGRPPSDTWLDHLLTGTCFVVRPKTFNGWLLQEFCLGGRRNGATMLIIMDNNQKMKMEWVDPVRFCQQFELYEITEEPESSEV